MDTVNGSIGFLDDMLNNPNRLVVLSVAAGFVFVPLYVLSSYGVNWAWPVAILAGLSILIFQFGTANRDADNGTAVGQRIRFRPI